MKTLYCLFQPRRRLTGSFISIQLNADGEDIDLDDDDDRENDEGNAPPRQRRRLDSASGSLLDGDDDGAEDGQQGAGGERANGAINSPRSRRVERERELRRQNDELNQYYSRGARYGKPSACVLFDLAHMMHRDTSYLLWLALVGLTDQYVHNKMERE